jgi:hypothetical protein
MSDAKRPDETIPGGKYLNATQDRYVDAWGKDLGPVEEADGVDLLTDEIEPLFLNSFPADQDFTNLEEAEAFFANQGDGDGNVIEPATPDGEAAGVTVTIDPESEIGDEELKPVKRTRKKADD